GALLALRHYPMVLGLSWTFFLINLAHQVFPATWVLYTGYRFDWGPSQVGMSLAFVGVMAAIVQGGLTRKAVPKLGEKRTALLGLTISIFSYIAYGLASQGWMVYAIIVWGSLGGLATPAIQGIVSQQVGADEQGGVQGSLTSLSSVAGILGPPLATGLFAYFVGSQAPFLLPGAAFFCAALIVVIAMLLMKRVFVLSRKSIMAGDCHLLKS
ncbi:MFS transporter, partial [Verrucomicrobiales bacterium]|nr:MFS transporter [Verrucomicrobiales bacterium]